MQKIHSEIRRVDAEIFAAVRQQVRIKTVILLHFPFHILY